MAIIFIEYTNQGGKDYTIAGNTFTFNPDPRSITKSVEVQWRIRKPGYAKKLERARFRHNEKIEFTLQGSCTGAKRDELEWYVKRDSLFKTTSFTMKTYHAKYTKDYEVATPEHWDDATEETVFLVFVNSTFTQNEAKQDWYDYTIKMKRVHQLRH